MDTHNVFFMEKYRKLAITCTHRICFAEEDLGTYGCVLNGMEYKGDLFQMNCRFYLYPCVEMTDECLITHLYNGN